MVSLKQRSEGKVMASKSKRSLKVYSVVGRYTVEMEKYTVIDPKWRGLKLLSLKNVTFVTKTVYFQLCPCTFRVTISNFFLEIFLHLRIMELPFGSIDYLDHYLDHVILMLNMD